jgi:peptidoglycan-associated lipoprotein
MKRILSALSVLTLSFVLVACGSNVKLSDVPVEDRSAGATGAGAGGAAGNGGASGRAVAPVEIKTTGTTAAGPVGAARVFLL